MVFIKRLPVYLLIGLLSSLVIWVLFIPKDDFTKRIAKTLEEQKKLADLILRGVTASETVNGEKFWELRAKSSSLDKTTQKNSMVSVTGTFFQNGKESLRILAPKALWNMREKTISLEEPIGYDIKFEKAFKGKISEIRNTFDPRSIFNLPSKTAPSQTGYWFMAHNLNWQLADKRAVCTGGIMLTKGNVIVFADNLSADIAMEHLTLTGSPKALMDSVTLEAVKFEVDSTNDLFFAEDKVRARRPDGEITSKNAVYKQAVNEIEFLGNVNVSYKDLKGVSGRAKYLIDKEEAILSGNAVTTRGKNTLRGDEIHILFREDKIFVKGKTKVKIGRDDLK
jgi:lipopolysaccharide export system protein LptA